ncbi:cytochrome b5-like heme/steroid binding domain-containing protein [Aspergillus keveii]|uniref:Cytochrome b5-like heme/steroid binding domain-containing protein n=1 Tax=Aspergillus keveii TaxID=714993 RepID=A0ABR4FN03_9EURO
MASMAIQLGKSITLEQLADHNTLQSLWVAVHGAVYDLTAFSSDHPGGIDALESCAGMDGTEAYEYAGHSEENTLRMQQYRVGELIETSGRAHPVTNNPVAPNTTHSQGPASGLRQDIFTPWAKLAVTLFTASGAMALSYRHFGSRFEISTLLYTTAGLKAGNGLLTGIVIASSISLFGFGYLYRLFLSSLDYQNDVFSFPPTIPKKARR